MKPCELVESFLGRNIRYYDGKKWWCSSVKDLVITVSDLTLRSGVEVVIDRRHNKYFSIDMFINGKSWVKKIEILDHHDRRVSKPRINKFIKENEVDLFFIKQYVESLISKSVESGW